ncbi:AAA family ATPase [Burkholderia sp. Ac-20365]|uniref:AAA family ATPase n=1 Tax=Burkholderia sp. Ac-20365 TaxID=2703897 RepID=UPI001F11946C|nr:AAA family ATPase [Burkholderia sp. Ac-20365]
MSIEASQQMLALTIVAAAAVWLKRRNHWGWTQAAFAVLSVGLLRLLFAFNEYSMYGAFVWGLAFMGMIYQHRRLERVTGQGTYTPQMSSAQGAAAQPAAQQPAQEYSYDHRIQRARYTFADIVGMADTKKRLYASAQEIVGGQAGNRNGMMLFGEPGNGKTMFAEALAGELNVPFFSIAYGDTASKFVNETPQKVKAVFEQAKRVGVCVLFVDEYDSFVKPRDGGAHHMDQDLTNVMLTEVVSLRGSRVVLVAATNFLERLDSAAIREGRFDFKIEIPPPDEEARAAILRKSIGEALGYAAVDPEALASLAQRWEGFSASRLTALGGQLSDMRRDGVISAGKMSFDVGMQAMRLMVGRRGKLPENVKSIDEIIMPAQSRDALQDLAYKMKNVHRLEKIGGRIPAGLVFYGPPGTGKTGGAMALAKESGFAFLKTTGAEIMAKPESWDALVREARDIRPAIVFIDEADDILRDRQYSNVGTLTNKILTTLDGGGGRVRDVVYIAATNHFDRLDPAALRGGRFAEKILFDVPGEKDMVGYLNARLVAVVAGKFEILPGTADRLIEVLAGRSIADADEVLQKAVDNAALRALRHDVAQIGPDDVSAAARVVLVATTSTQP